jgi:2-oxo-4-hydroxy-4-carboxy--5-ureidoimidazoline (OHCU) decarboxylase
MLNSKMTKKDILKMIAYVMENVRKENEEEYLELINRYPEISILSQEELEKLLLNISKLNDKIQNFDYELTWKMK